MATMPTTDSAAQGAVDGSLTTGDDAAYLYSFHIAPDRLSALGYQTGLSDRDAGIRFFTQGVDGMDPTSAALLADGVVVINGGWTLSLSGGTYHRLPSWFWSGVRLPSPQISVFDGLLGGTLTVARRNDGVALTVTTLGGTTARLLRPVQVGTSKVYDWLYQLAGMARDLFNGEGICIGTDYIAGYDDEDEPEGRTLTIRRQDDGYCAVQIQAGQKEPPQILLSPKQLCQLYTAIGGNAEPLIRELGLEPPESLVRTALEACAWFHDELPYADDLSSLSRRHRERRHNFGSDYRNKWYNAVNKERERYRAAQCALDDSADFEILF